MSKRAPKLLTVNTPAGPRRYSKKALEFIRLRAKGTPTELAAKEARISYSHAKRLQARPETKSYMLTLGADTLLFGVPRAAERVMEIVQQQDSTKSALEASALVLGIAGLKPTAPPSAPPQVNVGIGIGFDWSPQQRQAHTKLRATGFEPTSGGGVISTLEQRQAYDEAAALGATGMSGAGYIICLADRNDELSQPSPVIDGTAKAAQ